jgi:hypothetical protein
VIRPKTGRENEEHLNEMMPIGQTVRVKPLLITGKEKVGQT